MRLTNLPINESVYNFIFHQFVEEGYYLKRYHVLEEFDLPECVGTRVLRELQESDKIIWDQTGIRPHLRGVTL